MRRNKILILGAGLAGLSTAYFLKKRKIASFLFEKESSCGGLCRSYKIDGFTFDISGHLLHFRNKHSLGLIKSILGNNLEKHKRKAYVYTFNRIIPYPFQLNFHYLPKEISQKCLSGFIKAHNDGSGTKGNNFVEWSYYKFGKAITDYFMVPYNRKFWRFPLDKMHYKGIEKFIVIPKLRDIKRSISGRNRKNFGYSAFFWYPKEGGIEELTKGLAAGIKTICLNSEVTEVDLRKRTVKFSNGRNEQFDTLVSTVPLPELSRILKGLPLGIKNEFNKLKWLSIININFAVNKPIHPQSHWIYFPDRNVYFFRVGFFHNFSTSLAPKNRGSIYVEVSYSGGNAGVRNIVGRVENHLKKVGVIEDGVKIIHKSVDNIKYAYPIYDTNYQKSRSRILKFLSKNNIIACGRFGSWQYMSMEDVILESRKVSDFLYGKL